MGQSGSSTGTDVKLFDWIKGAIFSTKPASVRGAAEPPARALERSKISEDLADLRAPPARQETAPAPKAEAEDRPPAESERPGDAKPPEPVAVAPPAAPAEPQMRTAADAGVAPSQDEIERRRGMVRRYFNDYWSSVEDKPASFAERLDGAEGYINERVAAEGEAWQLDPATRKQLGLPPRKR